MELEGSHGPGGLVELASGVDMLIVSGRTSVPEEIFEELDRLRARAASRELPEPIEIGETEFGVAERNLLKYRYRLEHRFGVVGIATGSSLPAVRVQIRSEFLHSLGPRDALRWFTSRLEQWLGPIFWTISRIDLHADFQGWDLGHADLECLVSRARNRTLHDANPDWNGFSFGVRGSGTISCRIYNKTAEIAKKGGDYWFSVWGKRFDPVLPAIRVEFELHRDVLRQFQILTPDEALDAAGALWMYLTQTWLTHQTPTADATKARWPISEQWGAVQRARLMDTTVPMERILKAGQAAQYERLIQGLGGYLVSLAALRDVQTTRGVIALVPDALRDWEHQSKKTFNERVEQRLDEWRYR